MADIEQKIDKNAKIAVLCGGMSSEAEVSKTFRQKDVLMHCKDLDIQMLNLLKLTKILLKL